MEQQTYPPASLETAACLWEAVLDLMRGNAGAKGLRAQVDRCRESMGTSHLRLTVLGWVDAADADWATVKEECWDRPFDWEWIPEWIANNVDWSGERPELRSPRIVPGGLR